MIRRALDFRYRGADRGLQVAHMLEGGGQRLGQRLREPASLTGSPSKAIVGDTRCFFKFCLNQKDGRKRASMVTFGSGEHLLRAIVPYPQRIFVEEDMAIRATIKNISLEHPAHCEGDRAA
jgi:hypothetical protein